MSYIDNQIVELRRQVERLRAETPAIYSVEPKNPTENTVWIDSSSQQLKSWDWSNWIVWSTIWWLTDWWLTSAFTVTDYNTITWWAWVMSIWTNLSKTDYAISAWSFDVTTTTYFYWQKDIPTAIQTTTTAGTAVTGGWIIVAIWKPNSDITKLATLYVFWWDWSIFNITNWQIAAWAIDTLELAAWAVEASKTNIASINPTTWDLNANTVWTTQIVSSAVTPSKITSYNFQISAGTFTNNSPVAWKVAWTWVKVVYNWTEYTITNWNCDTTDKHVYWELANSTVFQYSTTLPALTNDWFLVLFNNSWTATFVWNSTVINWNRITTWSIVASNLAANTITANEIAASTITWTNIAADTITASNIYTHTITTDELALNTITASNIAAWTITANEILSNTITTNQIAANTITASNMNIGTLSAITADLWTITAWTITLDTAWYIRWWQTSYDTWTWFFLWFEWWVHKFSIWDSVSSLTWDWDNLKIKWTLELTETFVNKSYTVANLPVPATNVWDSPPTDYE